MLRNPVVIQQHQKVRVLFSENGVEVMNEGTALANAQEGQPVRVQRSATGKPFRALRVPTVPVEVGNAKQTTTYSGTP